MFGNKKSAAQAPGESPKAKSGKSAKKAKRVTAKSGPNIFTQHAEKIALVAIVGLVVFLWYRSLSLETLPDARTPESLSQQAQSLLTKASQESHWEEILPERQQFTRHQFHEDSKAARTPVDPAPYAIGRLEPPTVRELNGKRSDPAIFPPEQLHVRNVFGSLAVAEKVTDANRKEPFDAFDDAPPVGKRPARTRPPRGAKPGDEAPPVGDNTNQRVLKASYDLGAQINLGVSAVGSDGGGMGGRLGSGNRGGMGGPDGQEKVLRDATQPNFRLGCRPVIFNAITAVIPHGKHAEEYLRAFGSSGTYLPGRDDPAYLRFEIQRADVSGDPSQEVKEEQWETILTSSDISKQRIKMNWATHSPEQPLGQPLQDVIDPQASLGELTAAIPPILIRNYREFVKHPKIDWSWNPRVTRSTLKQQKKIEESDEEEMIVADSGSSPLVSSGSDTGFNLGGMPGTRRHATDSSSRTGFNLGGGMGGSGGAGFGNNDLWAEQPEFKMVRAYDFLDGKDRGKRFRYRMRIAMRDANYPENHDFPEANFKFYPAPTPNELEADVLERVAALRRKEDKDVEQAKKQEKFKLRSLRYTEWSQPSSPVLVSQPVEAFVGDVDNKGVRLVVAELVSNPPGSILSAEIEGAQRGTVLGAPESERDFIVPTTKVIKRVKKSVLPGAVLADYRGGAPLAGDRKDDPLTSAVEAMILRADGSVQFTNSLDDQMLYRMYTFRDEKEAAEANNDPSGAGGPAR